MGAAMVVACSGGVRLADARVRLALARRLLSLGQVDLHADRLAARVVRPRRRGRDAVGDAPLAAHQIAFQLWIFLALVLDAVAIAGQIIVGQELGAARPDAAFDASVRMIWLSVAVGGVFAIVLLALGGRDPAGVHLRRPC